MKKCCFIIPYFGKFPNYFQLFLNSCSHNPDYDWLLITDNIENYEFPTNVKKISMSFSKLQTLIQSKFTFKVSIERPFKLCDYRPAFGYIFNNYLVNYKWWGHCDIDTIMGDLNSFVTDDMLVKYDKLFTLGHFIMYKNEPQKNKLFMSKIDGKYWYKEVFTTEKAMIFDEVYGSVKNINTIYKRRNQKVYESDLSLNFNPKKLTRFIKTTYNPIINRFEDEKRWKNKLVVWDNGKILRYTMQNKKVVIQEYMYLHLQSRKMKIKIKLNEKEYAIIPNTFLSISNNNKAIQKEKLYMNIPKIETKLKIENVLQLDKIITIMRLMKGILFG